MKKAVIYARTAYRNQQIMEAQVKSAHEYAAGNGTEVVREYRDAAGSRTQFKKMMEDALKGDREFNLIIVWTMRRLSESETELETCREQLEQAGVEIQAVIQARPKREAEARWYRFREPDETGGEDNGYTQ